MLTTEKKVAVSMTVALLLYLSLSYAINFSKARAPSVVDQLSGQGNITELAEDVLDDPSEPWQWELPPQEGMNVFPGNPPPVEIASPWASGLSSDGGTSGNGGTMFGSGNVGQGTGFDGGQVNGGEDNSEAAGNIGQGGIPFNGGSQGGIENGASFGGNANTGEAEYNRGGSNFGGIGGNFEGGQPRNYFVKREPIYDISNSPWILRRSEANAPVQQQSEMKYINIYGMAVPIKPSFIGSARFRDCPYNMCSFTYIPSKADVVVFTGYTLKSLPIQKFWYRPPTQRWVFSTVDPIISDFGLDNDTYRSLFNWTATYKADSDIKHVLGKLTRRVTPLPDTDYSALFRQKTKMAAWFVSHCSTWSKREKYVERMTKVAPVDIFGGCGPLKCGQQHGRMGQDLSTCFPLLTNDYRFYLAFENSFCTDYISEKFFKLFVDVKVIPVVRGGIWYHSALPKGTFIDAADFETPEALMEYLVELGNDEEAYTAMLMEKDKWEMHIPSPWCEYCKKIHTATEEGHYEDIYAYLNKDPHECWPPQDLGPEYLDMDIRAINWAGKTIA